MTPSPMSCEGVRTAHPVSQERARGHACGACVALPAPAHPSWPAAACTLPCCTQSGRAASTCPPRPRARTW
eukprot:4646101-Prymnesium_polylepis.2